MIALGEPLATGAASKGEVAMKRVSWRGGRSGSRVFRLERAVVALLLLSGSVFRSGSVLWPAPGDAPPGARPVLTEILASNRYASFDEDGDSSDWVEIHNPTAASIDLTGYGLSDRGDLPGRWRFPAVSIAPGERMIVWLSGKDRFVPPPEAITGNAGAVAFEAKYIPREAEWRYLVANPAGSGPPAGWNRPGFDDSAFLSGRAGFGYGDQDDYTELPANTTAVFTRRGFSVFDPARVTNLVLRIDYDDGFVAFLNGVRVAESNAPLGPPDFTSVAPGKHEAGRVELFDLTPHLDVLRPGENVLAVVGLNDVPSSDMSLHPELGAIPLVLHANFELDAAGESLLLTDPTGKLVDGVVFGPQSEDHSYGRVASEGGQWKYLLTPTPGEPNDTAWFEEPISDVVEVAPPPGKQRQPVDVTISTTLPGITEIHYTLDGSEPTAGSTRYSGPIHLDRNTVIRAAGFIAGERSTRVSSSSYFFGSTIFLPIMSISMEPKDYADVHNTRNGRGRAWERPAFMEYFDPAGQRVVATGMGMRLHGGAGRGGDFETKKSYKVYFRGVYGDTKLRYPIIPDTPVEKFDKLVLRGGFNDSFRTNGRAAYIRDQLIRDLHEQMGALVSHGTWCVLYVNMKFRGLFNVVERLDEEFLSSYVEGTDWDVVKTGNNVVVGSRAGWDALRSFAVGNDLSNDTLFQEMARLLDIDNFTSYMILNTWAQNHDWPHNNWYAAHERVPGAKWFMICWDAEFGIGLIPGGFSADSVSFALSKGGNVRDLFAALLDNAGYREFFMREVDRHVNGVLSRDNVLANIERLRRVVLPDMPEEVAQFGRTVQNFEANVEQMRQFARGRSGVYLNFLRRSPLGFPDVSTPIVTSVDPSDVVNTGDVVLVLSGNRLTGDTLIYFNGVRAPDVRFLLGNRLEVKLPPSRSLDGPVRVIARNPETGERGVYEGLLTVHLPIPDPQELTPTEGSVRGGDHVTIFGERFLEGVKVFFGPREATEVTRVDEAGTQLDVVTPAGEGIADVLVANVVPTWLEAEEVLQFRFAGTPFVRGDVNTDGIVDISDAIALLAELFQGGAPSACKAAADANDSGEVDISDAVKILAYLFQGGEALPAPFPGCDVDVRPGALECEEGLACP